MMVNVVMLIPAIFLSFITFTSQLVLITNNHTLIDDLNDAKLLVSRLESSLHEVNNNVKDRHIYLSKLETRIQDLEKDWNPLQSSISSMKEESLRAESKIIALEEEVRQLWASLRKNNFDLHIMELKVLESEESMQAVVNEQWVQIQQFEQALLLGQIRLTKVQRQIRSSRCTFLKYMSSFSDNYLQKGHRICNSLSWAEGSSLGSFLSQTSVQLQSLYSLVKEIHHKLQGIVKVEMERHEITAKFSNEEILFFVASALIVLPILSAWMWLSSRVH